MPREQNRRYTALKIVEVMQLRQPAAGAANILRCVSAAACCVGAGADNYAAAAQAWPSKPLRLVTGSAPGGGSDFVARILAEKLGERFGHTVIVDNRPGAGGAIGADVVAKANPDGYTLLLNTGSAIAVNPALQKLPYDVKRDFAPVMLVSRAPFVLAVHPALPAKSVSELVQHAKANPGKLSYASSGIGAMSHLAMELFKTMTAVNVVHVPYRGSGPAAVDLIAGQVQLAMNNIVPTLPHVKSGRLRALSVSGPLRSPVLPEVPTVAQSGLPGYEALQWYGVLLPAKTPPAIAALLYKEISAVLQIPLVRTRLTEEGGDVVGSTPQQFAAYIELETVKWAQVVKTAHVRAE
jgi:tripartite-type tricarboxylate transporter receptor subunit TctC